MYQRKERIKIMDKKELSSQGAKNEFVKSIHKWLMSTLDRNGKSEYKNCFTIEGSSIMCQLPDNYFTEFTIPSGTKIEMKFVSKKS
jgi:hypothetical protein